MLLEFFEFYNPTKVVYGPGIASDFSDFQAELDAIGLEKYFVVSDKVIRDQGLIKKVMDGLTSAGITVTGEFLDIPPNSALNTVYSCAEQADP